MKNYFNVSLLQFSCKETKFIKSRCTSFIICIFNHSYSFAITNLDVKFDCFLKTVRFFEDFKNLQNILTFLHSCKFEKHRKRSKSLIDRKNAKNFICVVKSYLFEERNLIISQHFILLFSANILISFYFKFFFYSFDMVTRKKNPDLHFRWFL